MTVCERIDALLQKRNMSRRQLAIKAGIAPSSLQSAMQRNTTLSLDMLHPISRVLEVDTLYLQTGKHEQELLKELSEEKGLEPLLADAETLMNDRLDLDLLAAFRKLNTDGQRVAVERVHELTLIPFYQRIDTNTPHTKEKPSEGK